jgi:hypothetical protein
VTKTVTLILVVLPIQLVSLHRLTIAERPSELRL